MLRIAAFTGGRHVPSARFRVRQYIRCLRELNIDMHEFHAPLGAYPSPQSSRGMRLLWGISSAASRLPHVIRSFACDLTLLQREMLSTLVTWEPFTRAPRILDVDDAIWLNRHGNWVQKIANLCEGIICGNDFLAEHFTQWNPNVSVLPTGIDTHRFRPPDVPRHGEKVVIGWSGTSSGFQFLYAIERALCTVLTMNRQAMFRVAADKPPALRSLPPEQVAFAPWSPNNEIETLWDMDIGIMPIADSDWARGKCSFKMLSYMACARPVVASPVGMNRQVLSLGDMGLAAATTDDWVAALEVLIKDSRLRTRMGRTGRQIVMERFSTDVLAPQFARLLAGCC